MKEMSLRDLKLREGKILFMEKF